jgi:L-rhamnose mutarotase
MPGCAFKMFFNSGRAAKSPTRRDAIWRERSSLLTTAGVSSQSIHLDTEIGARFGYIERRDDHPMDTLHAHPLRPWSRPMKDKVRANPYGSPAAAPLAELFFLA